MNHLDTIRVGGKFFPFFHNNDTDGRELYDEDQNLVMVIDHSLNITGPDGKVGNLRSEGDISGGQWVLYHGPIRSRFETGVYRDRPGRDYCWENLEKAEVVALTHLLERKLPQIKRPDETEGGACD